MHIILSETYDDLKKREKNEGWYLVKQETDFAVICYLVDFLTKYQKGDFNENLADYIKKKAEELNRFFSENDIAFKVTKESRALRLAYYYGLLESPNNKYREYNNVKATEIFEEIKERTNGDFYRKELYQDIISNQIEKIFLSSPIDEEYKKVRKDVRIFPAIFLYKILIEIEKIEGLGRIYKQEFSYFVATSKIYDDYLNTILNIVLFRKSDQQTKDKFKDFTFKFDNRMSNALKQIAYLEYDDQEGYYSLQKDKKDYIKKLLNFYENSFSSSEDEIDILLENKSLKEVLYERKINADIQSEASEHFHHNRIIYGAPGTGKSFKLDEEKDSEEFEKYKRVTFHPSYYYSNFVGTYKPISDQKDPSKIYYNFVPGPFIELLVEALNNKNKNYLLIIEEINRAEVTSVFGDLFQLLDREKGVSKYKIDISFDLKNYLSSTLDNSDDLEQLYLPSNLYIWATMNSADQGVFPLDTAFKRRWNFEYMGIDRNENKVDLEVTINGSGELINWNDIRKRINQKLIEIQTPEDKHIGPFFLSYKDLLDSTEFNNSFKNKLIMYLFEDAARHHRREFFKGCPELLYQKICEKYDEIGLGIFEEI